MAYVGDGVCCDNACDGDQAMLYMCMIVSGVMICMGEMCVCGVYV